jgi:hypothetical protein
MDTYFPIDSQHRDETPLSRLELTECCHAVLHVAQDSQGLRTSLVSGIEGRPLRKGVFVSRIDALIEELNNLRVRLTGMTLDEAYEHKEE